MTRVDLSVTFVTRRPVDETGVHRLLVRDDDRELALFVAPGVAPLYDCEPGDELALSNVRLIDVSDVETVGAVCPDCGSQLVTGRDAPGRSWALRLAIDTIEPDVPVGIIDEATERAAASTPDGPIDDWQPREDSQRGPARGQTLGCPRCERSVDLAELPEQVVQELDRRRQSILTHLKPAPTENLGLATGGAKDGGNFRPNVEAGHTPRPAAITEAGLFDEYYFETGTGPETDALFAPRYASATSEHPVTGDRETYLAVGLDATLDEASFERPPLDLVVALDVSGSMESSFDEYYYDATGNRRAVDSDGTTKLEAATRAVGALTEQLRPGDRLGVVLFDRQPHTAKPLRSVAETDMGAIRHHLGEVQAGGATNLAEGFEAAVDLLSRNPPDRERERRVVFATDMMPNVGATDGDELTDRFADAATDGIHATFVGIGLDANPTLARRLSAIRGANHYHVRSDEAFERRLAAEFDYMVTPLVFDLELNLAGDGATLAAVHGAPDSDPATDRLCHVGTLFPSPVEEGRTRGGIILARLTDVDPHESVELVTYWTERDGGTRTERVDVDLPTDQPHYDNDGVRKAIALSRYGRTLREWARSVHGTSERGVDDWQAPNPRGEHERSSVPLQVSQADAERFATLQSYLATEREVLGDPDLERELACLDRLLVAAEAAEPAVTDGGGG